MFDDAAAKYTPGASVAMSQHFGLTQTDLFVVNKTGNLTAMWAVGSGVWQGPKNIGPAQFASGAPVAASAQFGISSQTDVFAINTSVLRTVSWANGGGWSGPIGIE